MGFDKKAMIKRRKERMQARNRAAFPKEIKLPDRREGPTLAATVAVKKAQRKEDSGLSRATVIAQLRAQEQRQNVAKSADKKSIARVVAKKKAEPAGRIEVPQAHQAQSTNKITVGYPSELNKVLPLGVAAGMILRKGRKAAKAAPKVIKAAPKVVKAVGAVKSAVSKLVKPAVVKTKKPKISRKLDVETGGTKKFQGPLPNTKPQKTGAKPVIETAKPVDVKAATQEVKAASPGASQKTATIIKPKISAPRSSTGGEDLVVGRKPRILTPEEVQAKVTDWRTRKDQINEQAKAVKAVEAAKGGKPRIESASAPTQPTGGAPKPRVILRKGTGKSKGFKPKMETTGISKAGGGVPMPVRVKPAPTDVPAVQKAAELKGVKAEAAGAATRVRPGKQKMVTPTERSAAIAERQARIEAREQAKLYEQESASRAEEIRSRRVNPDVKTPVTGDQAYDSKKIENAARKTAIEKHIQEKGMTRVISDAEGNTREVKIKPVSTQRGSTVDLGDKVARQGMATMERRIRQRISKAPHAKPVSALEASMRKEMGMTRVGSAARAASRVVRGVSSKVFAPLMILDAINFAEQMKEIEKAKKKREALRHQA